MSTALSNPRISGNSRTWPAFLLLCGGRFMVMLDLMIVVLALPAVQSSFGVTASTTQWALSIYALSFGGFLLLGGKAGDLFGRRRILVIGFATFSVASLLGGLAPTIQWFIAARALQGLGAALVSPTAFATVTTLFHDARQGNRMIAIWSALSGIAFPVGALLGGLLVAGPGWRWIMFVNVPLGLACGALAPTLIAEGRVTVEHRKLDVLGSATATIGLVALVWVLSEGNTLRWLSPVVVLPAFLAMMLLGAFVMIEKRSKEPVLRLAIFRDPSLVGANLVMLFGNAGLVSSLFSLSFFLQRSLSLSPEASGLAFIPTSLVFIVATNLSSRLESKLPARFLVVAGSIAMAAGFILYGHMGKGAGFLATFVSRSFFVGLFGVALPVLLKVGVAGVPPEHRGAASGLLSTTQQIGGAMGLAIMTMVENATKIPAAGTTGSRIAFSLVGAHHSFIACAIFLVVGAAAAMSLIKARSAPASCP
ncbi:MAG TPA: MFS transporter [Spirochaetia bacterium]|nr:MFS transporter [Spirochaetia bacterium]